MTSFFRLFLFIAFLLFFVFLFAVRAFIVWRHTGRNPIILSEGDGAHALMSRYLVLMMVLLALFVTANVIIPESYPYFLPIIWLENIYLQDAGAALMIIALVLAFVAQAQMRDSWRVGIDEHVKTALVTTGLFRHSRNPIYLGMVLALLGAFMIAPTAATLLVLVLSYVLMQIQIRLEEDYLTRLHGTSYLDYKARVRRWF